MASSKYFDNFVSIHTNTLIFYVTYCGGCSRHLRAPSLLSGCC